MLLAWLISAFGFISEGQAPLILQKSRIRAKLVTRELTKMDRSELSRGPCQYPKPWKLFASVDTEILKTPLLTGEQRKGKGGFCTPLQQKQEVSQTKLLASVGSEKSRPAQY